MKGVITMREILFRGKCFNTEEWVEGYLGIEVPDELVIQQFSYDEYFESDCIDQHSVKPETIGQYTGLTDKNGVKIFEGDILKNALDNSISVVEWSEAHTGFTLKTRGTIYGFPKIGHEVYKIIGNIYDSPELLEVKVHE